MKSLPYVGLILAILGASSGFAQDNDDDRSLQSLSPPPPPSSRLTRRTSSGALISTVQSNIVINDRERLTITVLGDDIVAQNVNVAEGVSSAYFIRFNQARCFFHSKHRDGDSEARARQFVSPVFPSLDLDDNALRGFGSDPASRNLSIEELSQLQLPPDQTPFMADEIFCFYPPPEPEPGQQQQQQQQQQAPRRTRQRRAQQQAIVLVEYSDRSTEAVRVNVGNNNDNNDNDVVRLDTGRFNQSVGPFLRLTRSLLRSDLDFQVSVRRAAVITASDRERTRCFFIVEGTHQQRQQAFTWQSPMLTPVNGATGVACESST